MADYAGAVAAIAARFAANFSSAPVQYQNQDPPAQPWPPASPASPWIYFEVIETSTEMRGVGMPGSKTWLTLGHIRIHVSVPRGYGFAEQLAIAKLAGDVFRAQTLYTVDAGSRVTCYGPSVQGADSAADDGNWFVVTVSIPFEFLFIA